MNKSKFLKKSLAMVLAVMLVIAMIPLGASAESVGDKALVSIEASNGTLTKTGDNEWTVTQKYSEYHQNNGDKPAAVELYIKSPYNTVVAQNAKGVALDVDNSKAPKFVVTLTEDATVYVAKDNITDKANIGGTYTLKLVKNPASTDTTIAEATLPNPAGADKDPIQGVVDNTAKTIKFTVPWGFTFPTTMTAKPTVGEDQETAIAAKDTPVTHSSKAENGNVQAYTVTVEEEPALTALSIAGVDAVVDEKDATKYTVTLPFGTDLEEEQTVTFTSGTALKGAKLNTKDVTSGNTAAVIEGENTLVLTSTTTGAKDMTYTITVAVELNSDTTIEKFQAMDATTQGFIEDGVVSGTNLTVTLPVGSTLEEVALAFTVAEGTKVTIRQATAITATAEKDENGVLKPAILPAVNLTKPVTVEVLAQNGQDSEYYTLTATAAENPNKNPAITAAKVVIGEDEYTGTVSGKTITFTVPYSTTAEQVASQDNKWVWAKTPATIVDDPYFAEDPFSGKNTVTIEADGGDVATYTLVFTKEAPKTGKTLESLSFTTAATADKVTADNTIDAGITDGAIAITLPYTMYTTGDNTDLVPTFTISEGAALYVAGTELTDKIDALDWKSGFYTEEDAKADPSHAKDTPKTTVKVSALKALCAEGAEQTIIVADEFAASKIVSGTTTIADLTLEELTSHVTVYTVAVDQAKAETGAALNTFSGEDGLVTAKVTSGSVAITTPATFADGTAFIAEITASKLATVKAGSDTLDLTAENKFNILSKDGETYNLYLGDDDSKVVTAFSVTNEAGTVTNTYTVSITVNPEETGAELTSLKVNGKDAVIDPEAKTAKVNLSVGADLTKVTMTAVTSPMADSALLTTDEDGRLVPVVDYVNPDDNTDVHKMLGYGGFATVENGVVDVTKPLQIGVASEDGLTVNYYTLTVTADVEFSDVKTGDYFYAQVMEAADAGIVKGLPNGSFNPYGNVTRRDFAIMVVRLLGVDVSGITTTPFSDVYADDYGLKEIGYCAANGILGGRGNGKYDPAGFITREEAAKIMANALELTGTPAKQFKDQSSISSWAVPFVNACAANGIIEGRANGNFSPKDKITRADTAIIMARGLNK